MRRRGQQLRAKLPNLRISRNAAGNEIQIFFYATNTLIMRRVVEKSLVWNGKTLKRATSQSPLSDAAFVDMVPFSTYPFVEPCLTGPMADLRLSAHADQIF